MLRILVLSVISAATVMAQVEPDANLKFEVASIKPNLTDPYYRYRMDAQPSSGRLTAISASLLPLILKAYGVRIFQVQGLSGWAQTALFDIIASVGQDTSRLPLTSQELSDMLRNLLEDRFQLRVHHETREMPIYRLAFADPQRKLGPGIHVSTLECAEYRKQVEEWRQQVRHEPPVAKPCGVGGSYNGGTGEVVSKYGGVPIRGFTDHMSNTYLQRAIIDETGLTGEYDIVLKFSAESASWYGPPPLGVGNGQTTTAPPLFAAFKEQLGLKLEPTRGPVDMLVIDHVERPTPD